MSKIGFKRLSRGVRLLTGHIYNQIQSALNRVTVTGVDPSNMAAGAGRFSIDFSFPFVPAAPIPHLASAALTLPPPQDGFRVSGVKSPGDPSYILETVSLSVDTRAEAAAIYAESGGHADGDLDFPDVASVAYKVIIYKKRMQVFGGAVAEPGYDDIILSLDYPNIGFAGAELRTNPQVREGLSVIIDPYDSYIVAVTVPSQVNTQTNSLMVSLGLRSVLLSRDQANAAPHDTVQNIPRTPDLPTASQYGAANTSPVSLTVPGATAAILAEPAVGDSGVQGSIEAIDTVAAGRLLGGYTERSRRFGVETISNQAAYDVIAVPMWGNGWFPGLGGNAASLPYAGALLDQPTVDRRFIPIRFPFVVHHVIAFANFLGGSEPTTATMKFEIGVGIGTGIRSDNYAYRQVAFASWTPNGSSETSYLLDEFVSGVNGPAVGKILNIPLVSDPAVLGTGYNGSVSASLAAQGTPFFIGKTDNQDIARSPAANAPGGGFVAIPQIDGKEQWIEVRWLLHDSAGIGALPAGETPIGRGGHWVYIIGKKHLC